MSLHVWSFTTLDRLAFPPVVSADHCLSIHMLRAYAHDLLGHLNATVEAHTTRCSQCRAIVERVKHELH